MHWTNKLSEGIFFLIYSKDNKCVKDVSYCTIYYFIFIATLLMIIPKTLP